jgi:hypothetical protein
LCRLALGLNELAHEEYLAQEVDHIEGTQ